MSIIYEYPLNECMRICLRLEYLFASAQNYLRGESSWDTQAAIKAIIDILELTDRPDIKSKLTNVIHSHLSTLIQLEKQSNVNKSKLNKILTDLDQSKNMLYNTHGKLAQKLRENDFLAAIKQRTSITAGTCSFSLPAYYLWLKRPIKEQQTIAQEWFNSFNQFQQVINLLLQLAREGSEPTNKTARKGFYQESLPTHILYQMVRIELSLAENIYPEISVGKHRLSIHFFTLDLEQRNIQIDYNIDFKLTYCKL